MTEFGTQYLPHWIRGRIFLLTPVLLAVLVIGWASPLLVLFVLAFTVTASLTLSLVLPRLIPRFGSALLYLAFALDIFSIALTIQYTHGISGGFATAYIVIALNAILLMGRSAFVRVASMILLAFAVQVGLEVLGMGVHQSNLPLWVVLIGQIWLLGTLLYTSYIVSKTSSNVLARWWDEKHIAETGRASAEQEQQRWVLINNVALRVQESTTPQQVHTSIGEELERVGLHCAIFEWAEPNVAMRVVYNSLPREMLEALLENLRAESDALLFPLAVQPALTQVVQTRAPFLMETPSHDALPLFPALDAQTFAEVLARFQIARVALAPMVVHDQVVGVLMVFGEKITRDDLKPFAALAQQAASALEKARLLTEQRKRAAQLELVTNIAARVSSAENAEQIIQPLVRQVGEQFGYDVVSIVLADSERRELYVAATFSALGEADVVSTRQPLMQGILGLVTRTGEPYLSRDTSTDLNYYSPHPDRDPIRSELTLPLRAQNRVIGVLDVESVKPDGFDQSEVDALTLLAEQVSAALSKTRLLALEQKRAAQLAVVSEIAARAAAFSDPDAIVRTMVELVQERFGYHHVCVSLYDAARNELEQRSAAGPNAHLYRLGERRDAGEGLIGLAARTRQTVYSGDLNNEPRYIPDPDKVANSALCVPLVSGRNVIGVLDVESEALYAFDANDIGAMETLANQMSAALEKARSLQSERRRAAQMALVNRIASRTARLMPTEQLVREAVDMIRAQFGYYNVAVLMNDEQAPGVRLVANVGGLTPLLQFTTYMTGGIIGYVAASGNTYLCPDPAHDARYVSPFSTRAEDPVRSELAIPLRRGETVIGVLDIQSEQRDAFTPSDITALEALGDQLAAALENARLFESEAQRVAQLDAVRVLSLKVTAERNLDVVLESIVASAAELVEADGSALYIVDETRGDLVVRISNNLEQDYVGNRLKIGEGLAGQVAGRGTPLIIEDYSQWDGRVTTYEKESMTRIMSVPLKWQGRVLGVINLHRDREHPIFNAAELQFANLFAAQAAIAMENARLLNALQTRLHVQQTLSDTSATLLETTDVNAILEQAAAAARRALNCEIAMVFLPDDNRHLVPRASAGMIPEAMLTLRLPLAANSLPATAYLTRTPALWSDANPVSLARVPSYAPRHDFRAGMSVPMLVGEQAVGVISINTRHERQFDATDVQTLALLANQTASALERSRYFVQLQRRVDELNLLFEGYRATSSTLEPDQVLARLLEQLVRAFDLTSAFFVHVDVARDEMSHTHEYFSGHAHARERVIGTRDWSVTAMPEAKALLAGQADIIQANDPNLPGYIRDYMMKHGGQTILRVPLVAGDQVIGYLSLWETRAPRQWSSDEVRFVQTMASQAAAALVNAQLYQAAQTRTRELQALHEASRFINMTLNVSEICERSVDSLRDILGYHHVSIYFLENAALHLQVQRGYDAPFQVLELGAGIIARAVATRQAVFLSNVSQEPGYLAALSSVQSEIAVPLLIGDRVLGALNVETLQGETLTSGKSELTEADVQMLTTFANQLVVVIENARLFQETQQGLAQVRTLHAASQAVNADLKLEAVLERVAHEFVIALDVEFCTLLELDDAKQDLVVLFDLDPEPRAHVDIGQRFPLNRNPHLATALTWGIPKVYRIDEPDLDPIIRQDLETYLCRTQLTLPLLSKGQVIGVIELGDRKQTRNFRADEIRLAESLASQAAVALENARLYRAAQQRLQETETLYRFASDLSGTLDIEQLGKRALEAAARLSDFDLGTVSLVRESDGALVPFVISGSEFPVSELVITQGEGVSGWVVEHGRTVRLGDVTRDPRYRTNSPHMMSEICLPLRVGARVIGVLNLEAKAPDAFDAHAEELLSVFANQLAIAIENARLYEQTKRDADVKAALLRELSHRVKNNLAAITSLLYMALDEPPEAREQILSETLGRVQSMALAHGLLARSGLARVNLVELGRQVLNDTVRNLARPGKPILVDASGDTVQVGAHQTTTLALVLNELATNSLRHGFGNADLRELPMLRFSVSARPHEVECFMEDNGNGLPDEFAVDTDAGLGLNLVRTLVEKDLHGRFRLERRAPWTRAEIHFRLADPESPAG